MDCHLINRNQLSCSEHWTLTMHSVHRHRVSHQPAGKTKPFSAFSGTPNLARKLARKQSLSFWKNAKKTQKKREIVNIWLLSHRLNTKFVLRLLVCRDWSDRLDIAEERDTCSGSHDTPVCKKVRKKNYFKTKNTNTTARNENHTQLKNRVKKKRYET